MKRALFPMGWLAVSVGLLFGPVRANSENQKEDPSWVEVELNPNLLAVFEINPENPENRIGEYNFWVKNTRSKKTALLATREILGSRNIESLKKLGLAIDESGRILKSGVIRVSCDAQDLLEYLDYNFDGEKDLHITLGFNGVASYGSLFFADAKREAVFDQADSVQGSEFARDPKTRTLTVSSYERGGNVQYEDYGFRRGKWGLLRQFDHDQKSSPFIVDTEARFKNGKEYRGSKTISLYGDREARFGFRLLGRDKELLMVEGGDGTLYYAFGKRGKGEEHDYLMVELAFPEPGGGQGRGRGDFFALQRDAGRLRLSFARGDAKYEVFQEAGGGAGVRVEQKGKVKEWKADPGTIRGSLEFPEGLPVNVRVR